MACPNVKSQHIENCQRMCNALMEKHDHQRISVHRHAVRKKYTIVDIATSSMVINLNYRNTFISQHANVNILRYEALVTAHKTWHSVEKTNSTRIPVPSLSEEGPWVGLWTHPICNPWLDKNKLATIMLRWYDWHTKRENKCRAYCAFAYSCYENRHIVFFNYS